MEIVQLVILIGFPAVIVWLTGRYRKIGFLSPILLCYIAGLLLANVMKIDGEASMTVSEVTVPLAIPLLLFATNFFSWLRLAKKMILSFCLVIISAMISALVVGYFFAPYTPEYWKIAGMLVGVYTGGTPNLMAISTSLGVQSETLILVNAADFMLGGLYLLFLMLAAQRVLHLFLPKFKQAGAETASPEADLPEQRFSRLGFWAKVLKVAAALGGAVLIVGAGIGLSMLLAGGLNVAVVILTVTTLGIACSFHPRIRGAEAPFPVGQYLLLIFSMAMGTLVNIREMLAATPVMFLFTAAVMFGAILIHFALAALCRIDADTTIITSTAGIYGPAFIGPIAGVLKNREVLAPGLLSGLVGYALGNYLGLTIAYLLLRF